ncbi:MAG: elongation factor G, partial [Alphaproteobacteria bacterium]
IVLLRAMADGLKAGAALACENIGGLVDVDTKTGIGPLAAGEIGIAVKADHLSLRAPLYTADGAAEAPGWAQPHRPNLRLIVTPKAEKDDARLSGALARLCEIDPGLALDTDAPSGHAVLCAQSPTHARWVTETLKATFGVEVTTTPLAAQLCETIRKPVDKHYRHRKQTGGAGQFADVVIKVRPLPRGEGFVFTEEVKGGAVPRNYIPAVEQGARDALAAGPHGHPVVDVAVTLVDGKSHPVDSSDFAFRTAGRQAVKEALEEAGTVVLQPINRVTIFTPSVFSGALVPAVSGLKGQVLGFEADPDAPGWDRFNALLPASAEADLFNALASATRGTAWFVSELDHYEEAYDLAHA